MFYEDDDDYMVMPTPCQKCGKLFDLHDGVGSDKWFPNTVICEKCGDEEAEEIEKDNRIEELKAEISDLEWTIEDDQKRLEQLKDELEKLQPEEDY